MSPYAARMPGKVKGGCEVDVQDEREGLIRTLLVELGGQILVLFFPEESEVILPGGVRAFFFRYSSFRLALLLIVDGPGFFLFIFLSALQLLEASSSVSREKLEEPTVSARLRVRFRLTNAWLSPKPLAATSSSLLNEFIVE